MLMDRQNLYKEHVVLKVWIVTFLNLEEIINNYNT